MNMNFEFIFSPEGWIIIGVVSILLELAVASAAGFLFIGLSCITVGAFLIIFPELEEYQFILFVICSFMWAAVLMEHVAKYQKRKAHGYGASHSDLIGQEVEVHGADLLPGHMGYVKWSGTILNAELAPDVNVVIPIGTLLKVININGNVVICDLKQKR